MRKRCKRPEGRKLGETSRRKKEKWKLGRWKNTGRENKGIQNLRKLFDMSDTILEDS